MTTADKFASEWSPLLSSIHRQVPLEELPAAFKAFVKIPEERFLTANDNQDLLADFTESEVLEAVAALSRQKAAGPDGLNNDFYKDTGALLVPALLTISNQILHGEPMPPSFLEAMIIPLRKKGDSSDAMDYRPISLLQSSYKIFAKVMATRLQRILPRLVGDSQQGFVHGRQMLKTVMMMLAQLATATTDDDIAPDDSRVILLLDFRKAYDTVDREFLYETLRNFGFDDRFVKLIERMHTGTTASFVVNGSRSEAIPILSGIRQGCPLAPLLFLLVAEILGIAIQQDPQLRGLPVPGLPEETHIFSAFVDDSTIFLEHANQLAPALGLVKRFGQLSGLHAQPTKSKLIFLNKAVKQYEFEGIEVLQEPNTTRYLGYEVGTGQLTNRNWADRIRKIQRRLLTASKIATSVENRVLILNAIVLPAILFTAAVFDLPEWAETQLRNLYKQFLWAHSTSTESSRHKINPGLLVTPKKAGGVGLASVVVAIKTQRIKHALLWLTQREDKYFAAWRRWAYRGIASQTQLSPRHIRRRQPSRSKQTPGYQLSQGLGELLSPTESQQQAVTDQVQEHSQDLLAEASSWWENEEWIISFYASFPTRQCSSEVRPEEITQFWGTFSWRDNPWIRDSRGEMLTRAKYDRIADCTLAELHIQRTGPDEFILRIPSAREDLNSIQTEN